jgi:elongation factor Ts
MAEVTASMIKDLRERTGAGMSDCKKALVECDADLDKAIEFLRKKGLATAAKKAGRTASEGTIATYVHGGGRIAVLVEVNCETDFVGKNPDFQQFAKDVAMQICAATPQWVSREEVPADAVEREKAVLTDRAKQSGKPEGVIGKMVEGQLNKWFGDVVLLEQVFVKDPEGKKTVQTLLQELVGKIGENLKIRRFVRFEVGEGLEKKKDDFAAEVMAQAGLKS